MTLVQQLPLVIGDKIPEEVNHWKYFYFTNYNHKAFS